MSVPLPQRGEVWLADLPGDKIRPVVILTREPVIRHLHSVIAAPVTSTVRGIPTEVSLASQEGLLHDSVANFDNLQLVPRTRLVRRIGALSGAKLADACRALRFATAC
ncbi:MAG: type II toxin-antitoxin system PemK/MazF family toxin [Acidimicrobiales bacterium]